MAVDDSVRTGTIEPPYESNRNRSLTSEELSSGALCHIAGVAGILGTVICWMVKKDTSKWVDEQGKQAVNFHLTNMIISFICMVTIIGIVLIPPLGIYSLIMSILGGMKVQKGEPHQYPFSFNLIK